MLRNVVILTAPTCVYCKRAKDLLDGAGIHYTAFDVSLNPVFADFLEASNLRTVPQIYTEGKHIGGYTDLLTFLSTSTGDHD
jgi:glutaredoxin 3